MTSRAFIAALWVCLAALTGTAFAQNATTQGALPPPPYAASERASNAASAPPVGATYDRYGGGTVHKAPQTSRGYATSGPMPAYVGPRLAWGGKTAAAVLTPSAPSPEGWRRMTSPVAYAPVTPSAAPRARLQYPSMMIAASSPVAAANPYIPASSAPAPYTPERYAPPPTAAPTSIYDPAPPSAGPAMPSAPVRTAAAQPGDGPRLYSLHRDYGMAPDPIPLAPQFFGPTADLTTPETPEVGHRTKTSTGAVINAPTDASGGQ